MNDPSSMRDIGLLLVGYALAGETQRAHTFGMIEPEELPSEIATLLTAIRDKNVRPLIDWLDTRHVIVDKGIKVVDAVGRSIRAHTKRQARQSFVATLAGGSKLMTEDEFIAFVDEELGKLKKVNAR